MEKLYIENEQIIMNESLSIESTPFKTVSKIQSRFKLMKRFLIWRKSGSQANFLFFSPLFCILCQVYAEAEIKKIYFFFFLSTTLVQKV